MAAPFSITTAHCAIAKSLPHNPSALVPSFPRRSLSILDSVCRDVLLSHQPLHPTSLRYSTRNGRATHWYSHPSKPVHFHADTDPIVLDGGTGFLKVGYAAQVCLSRTSPIPLGTYPLTACLPQNFPEHQFPSIVGRPILRSEERAGDIVVKDIMCGDEAAAARSMLQISYPVCAGSIRRPLSQSLKSHG